MKRVALKNLRDIDKELLMSARSAMEGAYNPYSNFFVGAAVLTADNSIVSGANFENATFNKKLLLQDKLVLLIEKVVLYADTTFP